MVPKSGCLQSHIYILNSCSKCNHSSVLACFDCHNSLRILIVIYKGDSSSMSFQKAATLVPGAQARAGTQGQSWTLSMATGKAKLTTLSGKGKDVSVLSQALVLLEQNFKNLDKQYGNMEKHPASYHPEIKVSQYPGSTALGRLSSPSNVGGHSKAILQHFSHKRVTIASSVLGLNPVFKPVRTQWTAVIRKFGILSVFSCLYVWHAHTDKPI